MLKAQKEKCDAWSLNSVMGKNIKNQLYVHEMMMVVKLALLGRFYLVVLS